MIQIVTKDKTVNKLIIHILICLVILFSLNNCYASDLINSQANNIGINTYINEINTYIDDDFKIDFNDLFQNLIKGDTSKIKQTMFDKIFSVFGKEVKENVLIIINILIIILISSLLSSLTNGFGKSQVSNKRFFYSIYYYNYINNDKF